MGDDDAIPIDSPVERSLTPTPQETVPVFPALTPEEYFSHVDLKGRDIGRYPRVTSKVYMPSRII